MIVASRIVVKFIRIFELASTRLPLGPWSNPKTLNPSTSHKTQNTRLTRFGAKNVGSRSAGAQGNIQPAPCYCPPKQESASPHQMVEVAFHVKTVHQSPAD